MLPMSKKELHSVILIPGLGDDSKVSELAMKSATHHWKDFGLHVVVHAVFWRNNEAFEPKLLRVLALIDDLASAGTVSLVGVSAGASMAFNAFHERKNSVHRAVNVCGRLRTGKHRLRSLERMAATSIAFKQSVHAFERNEGTLRADERSRLMTIRPFFGDELVPHDTAYLAGAQNRWIYTAEHGLSILLSLRLPGSIVSFLTEQQRH